MTGDYLSLGLDCNSRSIITRDPSYKEEELRAEARKQNEQVVAFGMLHNFVLLFGLDLVEQTVVYIASFGVGGFLAEQVNYVALIH